MADKGLRLFAVFAGRIDDGGFIESGYQGARAACARLGIALEHVAHVGVGADELAAAIEAGAAARPDLILAHGGSSDHAVAAVAPRHPAIRFLSTHGETAGSNFSSFTIAQPQSAFLAGALAGWMTRSGVVGHLSGIRIAPGLRSRAAYAAGVRAANPQARLVTCFCGTQEDNAVTRRAADAEIDAGVDILYTMLNGGRQGAIEACRARGVAQIGNVRDWTTAEPDVFVASAIADTGRLVVAWLDDVVAGRLVRGEVRTLGMEDPHAVRLALAPAVPAEVRARLDRLASDLAASRIALPLEYSGPELTL
ncbi:MAG: BMP family protein [Burkholderiales bacterium]|nr:BMP family protein [Burkholderiales bacterium]